MIKYDKLKPIVIDKERHLLDINNWILLSEDWCDLDYTKKFYHFELEWDVNEQTIITEIELYHDYTKKECSGSIWAPPSTDIVSDDVEVYILKITNYDTGVDYNINYNRKMMDLGERLELYIEDEYF